MELLDIPKEAIEVLTILIGNGFAWMAGTEQIWFPTIGAYVRFIAPTTQLPDLRGPFLAITMLYIGLRLGDMIDKGDELEA
ncbi:MAG: hypothetical protein ABEJ55_07805 [Halanaeroarchaeum sp.]